MEQPRTTDIAQVIADLVRERDEARAARDGALRFNNTYLELYRASTRHAVELENKYVRTKEDLLRLLYVIDAGLTVNDVNLAVGAVENACRLVTQLEERVVAVVEKKDELIADLLSRLSWTGLKLHKAKTALHDLLGLLLRSGTEDCGLWPITSILHHIKKAASAPGVPSNEVVCLQRSMAHTQKIFVAASVAFADWKTEEESDT